jgi:hypothetical protein
MIRALDNLDGENIERPDELAPLRQVSHTWLQQHQHDDVNQVMQHLQQNSSITVFRIRAQKPDPRRNLVWYLLWMHRILFLPDTGIRPAGYPANPKAGYRISG